MASSSSSPISTFDGGYERSQESNRKKRRKIIRGDAAKINDVQMNRLQWKTNAEQQIYSVNLVEALRRTPSSPETVSNAGIRSIRETADRVLAVSARGRTRWSRAILSCRLRSKLVNKRHKKVKLSGKIQPKRKPARTNAPPPLQRKVQILGRLVPGCRKLPFHNLLEETTDYIAALEMQIKAMSALAVLLNGAGSSTAAGSDQNS
ncbi:transcription factor bHLH149-like [Impatiens glandulifera]|uniref:transcription factor bHLH149-like n=1 Tax=Impatiens glandulifera TaxID=253017 RepID=UPI001FB18773|nr:transcription factor bHLH149-like [Impatiens glandulifera]